MVPLVNSKKKLGRRNGYLAYALKNPEKIWILSEFEAIYHTVRLCTDSAPHHWLNAPDRPWMKFVNVSITSCQPKICLFLPRHQKKDTKMRILFNSNLWAHDFPFFNAISPFSRILFKRFFANSKNCVTESRIILISTQNILCIRFLFAISAYLYKNSNENIDIWKGKWMRKKTERIYSNRSVSVLVTEW